MSRGFMAAMAGWLRVAPRGFQMGACEAPRVY